MAEGARDEVRYTAFLSYSHKDAAAAGKLHRRLESYRMPRRLAGTEGARGPVPERLAPIFRDREELPAASDLSETVRNALAQSGALIILCSPYAAESLWVAEEIETFRKLHPDRPILAVILDGDPPACFPAALRAFGRDGTWHEPLATDLRRGKDGAQLGLLKLVAGITGVGLDELVQRDAARRIRRVMAVTAAAVVAMLIMAALAMVALQARREADRQRAEAEGLIEFMLTDLREELRGVGRLEVMDAANRRALEYYDRQLSLNPRATPLMRARVVQAIGEDEMTAGNRGRALERFREAFLSTGALLAESPQDSARIFAHAQSEYWLGYFDYDRHDFAGARRRWMRYRELADRLVAIDGRNPSWLREQAYAQGNLCTVAREGQSNLAEAHTFCFDALATMRRAANAAGRPGAFRKDLANRHAEIVDTLLRLDRPLDALPHQRARLRLLDDQLAEDPANAALRVRRVWAVRALAHLEARLGQFAEARRHIQSASEGLEALVNLDRGNQVWSAELTKIASEQQLISQGRDPRVTRR